MVGDKRWQELGTKLSDLAFDSPVRFLSKRRQTKPGSGLTARRFSRSLISIPANVNNLRTFSINMFLRYLVQQAL